MKSSFSKSWNRSVQVRKQRKFRFNAPLHIKGKFLHSKLDTDLAKKYGTKTLRVRKGDKVKVMRGSYKGDEYKVEEVNIKKERVYLEKISKSKIDGSKARVAFNASNLKITSLNLDDKKRFQKTQKHTEKVKQNA